MKTRTNRRALAVYSIEGLEGRNLLSAAVAVAGASAQIHQIQGTGTSLVSHAMTPPGSPGWAVHFSEMHLDNDEVPL